MRLALLGVGLIGGSIGLAAKRRLAAEVRGFDPDSATAERALELGALDTVAGSIPEAVEDAELVLCAGPVSALPDLVHEALEATEEGVAVSDVGSTKRGLAESVAGMEQAPRFVGGHPLAGAETAGVENARADLFEGARWFLTPTERSEGVLLHRLHGFVADIGARPQAIDPVEHDRVMATISHLPHVLANVLASRAAETLGGNDRRSDVGRSFRDTTRVAGANPAIWGDIFAANSDAVAEEVEAVIDRLREAAALLHQGDPERLEAWQQGARDDRRGLLDRAGPGGELFELRLAVENRPGVVAEIALALGRAAVNIEDMSLAPSSDRRTGAISLWIAGADEAVRASGIVSELGHAVSTVSGGS
jgi:prephenate dehydrogenase